MEVIIETTPAAVRDKIADWLVYKANKTHNYGADAVRKRLMSDLAKELRNIPVISEIMGEPTFEDMRLGLMAAISLLGKNEPGDSRAVSDEFVALASIEAGRVNEESRELLRRVIGTTVRPG